MQQLYNCINCDLCISRNNIVNGTGNRKAPIMIIGEAPGYKEDKIGVPFVGKSGMLLNKCLNKCCLYRDKQLYITNVVKCRPYNNKTPTDNEIDSCSQYLAYEISYIKPDIILLLGKVAANIFLDTEVNISKYRGVWMKSIINNKVTYIIITYHPSYILRNTEHKLIFMDDIIKISNKYTELINPLHKTNMKYGGDL